MVITVCLKKAYWDISHSLNTEKIKKNIQWRGEGSMIWVNSIELYTETDDQCESHAWSRAPKVVLLENLEG